MSAPEAASRPRELINSDRMLLGVLSVLLLSHAGLYYVCLRFNLPFAFAFAWSAAGFVLDLQLPESIASAIIENLFMLVVGDSYAFILTVRFIELQTWKSPSLLSCAVLLSGYNFGGADALDYCFDQIRFQFNRPAYLAMAKSGEGWPDSAIIRWGETGFLDTSIQYLSGDGSNRRFGSRRDQAGTVRLESRAHEVQRLAQQVIERFLFNHRLVCRNLTWRRNFERSRSG